MQLTDKLSPHFVQILRCRLLVWFRDNRRKFPWRDTDDPYAVLLAEKLLQRTAVRKDLVASYEKLLSLYPNPNALAIADTKDVQEITCLLGLRYRAGEMIALANALCERYGGIVPNDLDSLLSLPGVGEYTARAVLCFAFSQDVSVVDTNVARILYRVFGVSEKVPLNPARKRNLTELASALVPTGQSREFNWAMLDMGAAICRAGKPKCSICPIVELCLFPRDV